MALIGKREESLELAASIIESGETDVTDVSDWSDEDLYEWIELWGFDWQEDVGWVDLEDL